MSAARAATTPRSRGTLPLIFGLVGAFAGALIGRLGGTLMVASYGTGAADGARASNPLIVVIAGGIIGIGVPLIALGWYFRRKVPLTHVPHHVQAMWIGLVWGTIAVVLAGPLNGITGFLPAGKIYPGIIEEFLKLLLPVILLLASRTYRSPLLAAWMVFVAAAWLGFVEGISYIVAVVNPFLDGAEVPSDAAFDMMMDVIIRTIAEVSHPLITVGAAVIIWLAARSLPKGRAVGVGILAYLGAAAIHGLNDAVLDGPVRDWNVPVSIVLTAVYVVAIFLFWFRPQVYRLQLYCTEHSARTAAAGSPTRTRIRAPNSASHS
jgi:PrsW family intramembrane metalloprotease